MKIDLTDKLFIVLVAVLVVSFCFAWPEGWLISDEYTYVNQAIAYLDGVKWLGYTDPITQEYITYKNSTYTLGNASWILVWMSFLGVRGAYFGSLVAMIGGLGLIYLTIRQLGYCRGAIVLGIFYPATVVYLNTQMSGVPSFLMSSLFLYLLMKLDESRSKWFVLTMIAAFSFWFRETNMLLLGGICLIHFLENRKWLFSYALGGIVGVLPRLVSAYYCYDDPFYYVQGGGFSLSHGIDNLALYFVLGMIMMPLSWFVLGMYKGRYRWPIVVSTLAFLILYLVYEYNATGYSGYTTGTIVMSRFLLPVLPFYIWAVAYLLRDVRLTKAISMFLFVSAMIVGLGLQWIMNKEQNLHAQVSMELYGKTEDKMVMLDLSGLTNVIRYVNPMRGKLGKESDISNIADDAYMRRAFELSPRIVTIQSINTANQQKAEKTDVISSYFNENLANFAILSRDTLPVKGSMSIVVIEIEETK